jgi:NAD(P)-dependent dehydrogenase (short-subunit alcohol dehydrogenase family)
LPAEYRLSVNSVLRLFDVSGRTALVTGAASGLGLAFAETLAEAGAAVTLADLSFSDAEREAARLVRSGWRARASQVDVSQDEAVRAAVDAHVAAYGGLDVVFANAGIGIGHGFMRPSGGRDPAGQIDTFELTDWQRTLDVNLSGALYTIRHAARVMKASGKSGSIIVTSSNASEVTVPIVATAYMAAKAGVAHLVRQAALELAAHRIRVNAIAPGSFVTNIGGGVLQDPAAQAVWDKAVPLGKMGQPQQIKGLALYLASDASDFMTGAQLFIDGGVALGAVAGL